jgi:Holliday junction DNA helicase RuvA
MIGFLQGEVLEQSDGRVVVLAGAGVGYAVNVPSRYALLPGAQVRLFIHTHVREDALELFGFCSREEKDLFLTLLTVNGIGPKGALGILGATEPEGLVRAILDGDRAALTAISGVGKKTAERIVLELADPVAKKVAAGLLSGSGASAARAAGGGIDAERALMGDARAALMNDAKAALIGLGYREMDAAALLKRAGASSAPATVEELVREALRATV